MEYSVIVEFYKYLCPRAPREAQTTLRYSRMSREIVALCDRLLPLPKDDEWSDRVVALEELQELVRSSRRGSSSSSSNAEWSASTLLLLHEPMVRQLKDLRSAVVREACAAVSLLAVELGSGEFGALGAKLVPELVDLSSCGNSVIVAMVRDCLCAVVEVSQTPRLLGRIADVFRGTRNKDLRESILMDVFVVALRVWNPAPMVRDMNDIVDVINQGLSDASGNCRRAARTAFAALVDVAPHKAAKLMRSTEGRTRKALERLFPVPPPPSTASSAGSSRRRRRRTSSQQSATRPPLGERPTPRPGTASTVASSTWSEPSDAGQGLMRSARRGAPSRARSESAPSAVTAASQPDLISAETAPPTVGGRVLVYLRSGDDVWGTVRFAGACARRVAPLFLSFFLSL